MIPQLVVIGLGNPGSHYDQTRHNAGFLALDELHRVFATGEWKEVRKYSALTSEARIGILPILLIKPQLFMNRSGESVQKILQYLKIPQAQCIILYDDIDIPLGTVRLRKNGSAGTHNGMRDIVEKVGSEIPRLRIGIGPVPEHFDVADFVLSKFPESEYKILQGCIATIPEIIKEFIGVGE